MNRRVSLGATFGWLLCSVGCPSAPTEPPACVSAPETTDTSCLEGFADVLPEWLSETGCFSQRSGVLTPSPGLIPYTVAAPLFSDFADKQRFLMLPTGTTLTQSGDQVTLPVGAALFKHFAREGVSIETRAIVRTATGHRYVTYVWDGEDARLMTGGTTLSLELESGAALWAVPSGDECTFCHASDLPLLGLAPDQLATSLCVDDTEVDQLAAFGDWGVGQLTATTPLADPSGEAPLDARARSYLHTNCAHCHRPAGWAVDIDLDLRFATPFAETQTCNVPNQYFAGPTAPVTRLTPGSADDSSVAWRIETDNDQRMAPFGFHTDPAGIDLIREWIDAMASCPN